MSDPAKVKDAIKKEIAPAAAKYLQEFKEITTVFGQIEGKLMPALATGDEPTLKLEVKALVVETARIADLLSRTKVLLDKLEKMESDESFVDDLTEVEQFSETLNKMRTSLDAEFSSGKQLEDTVNKALAKHVDGEREVVEKRAELEAWFKKQMAEGAEKLKAMQKTHEDIVKALQERDEEAVTKGVKTSFEIRNWAGDLSKETDKRIKEFQDYIGKINPLVLSKSLHEEFAKGDDKMAGDSIGLDIKIVEIHVRQKDSKIKPPDYKKAATLLKIPATHTAKLNKALDAKRAVMVKLLDVLAKELHQHTSGKDMVAVLDKEHVI